jgi:RNA recognition motif-containing protein
LLYSFKAYQSKKKVTMVKRRDREEGGRGGDAGPRTAKKSRSATTDGSTVFVGNLAFKTSWQNLKDHMRKAGNVESVSYASPITMLLATQKKR